MSLVINNPEPQSKIGEGDVRPLAVIGLGYVGLPLAVEFGKRRSVIGFDVKPGRIAELREGRDSTREVSREELAEAAHLDVTDDPAALAEAHIFIVTVPTPIDAYNCCILDSIEVQDKETHS